MPRIAKELSALDVKRLTHPGKGRNFTYAVGGVSGLYLQLTPNTGRTWLLRVKVGDKRREIGLGGYPDVTLAIARERARETKDKIRQGIDPIEERKAAKASLSTAQRRGLSFADAVDKCLAAKLDAFKNPKHRQQWRNTLTTYAMPDLGPIMVQDIAVQDVLRVLEPIWQTKTETATRLRGRIEAVLSWATVAGHRTGDNPARWAGNLKELMPAPSKVATNSNQPALQIDDAPRWLAALRGREGMGSRALEFAALTAARSQEVRGARWDEIDMGAGLWTIPADRMKMTREHRVPLSSAAVDILKALPRFVDNPLVFPAPRGGEMSDMTLSAAMKRLHKADVGNGGAGFVDRVSKRPAVPHGLRSTFRDWVAERTHFPGDMAEVALAHRISSAVEASYRRGDMVEKRRAMMAAWAEHLTGKSRDGAKVVRIG
ncbi:MAG: integrase arm-type DNA-binding domain-containing protein [Alphaproteobacteria bacterium]|nr:integrase arm-type DNA-binding domain-containing protein [Alphaproteobacteria bacterium]MBU1575311.1 integrase arm-type DNA-binding domain-containing protein [Alphaproteobacteria bacterium]MBU1829163.1 integrase arm-type DNA-binding domain-containing protein [Alphaproteobacteria bacterium]MBU2079776.1 integrase arm-type DNA-binding domain-containing protein [Alphaproteobacteria bacterium]MBU2162550.1 integrase arm-type DNA-binding domain-containing protein [Alphaproteobacteria bacterium]